MGTSTAASHDTTEEKMYYQITQAEDVAKVNAFLKQEQIQVEQDEQIEAFYLRTVSQALMTALKNDPDGHFDYRITDDELLPALIKELQQYLPDNETAMLDAIEVYHDLYVKLPD